MQRLAQTFIVPDKKLTNENLWDKAIQDKSYATIKKLLEDGFIPNDLNVTFPVLEWDKAISKNLIQLLIDDLRLGQEAVNFDVADQLLSKGAPLPKPHRKVEDFDKKSDYFHHLANSYFDLYIALRTNPAIIKEQDENGDTIAHHAARIGVIMGSNSASIIHYLIFEAKELDLSIKNADGNTPLHVAANYGQDRTTHQYIFMNYVKCAIEKGFDFSTLNNNGKALIHLVTMTCREDYYWGHQSNLKRFLDTVPDIDINLLSESESTALFYAINHMYFSEASLLLDRGADPTVGREDRKPLAQIDAQLHECHKFLSVLTEIDKQQQEYSKLAELDIPNEVNWEDIHSSHVQHLNEIARNIHQLKESIDIINSDECATRIQRVKDLIDNLNQLKQKINEIIEQNNKAECKPQIS